MGFDYNPFTSNFDAVGGGAAYIDGEVATPADLPITLGTPAVGVVYLAQEASGTWFVNYRPGGLYKRTANVGTVADWTYLGAFPETNRDDRFRIYNVSDTTKQVAFDVSGVSTGTTRTLTVPNANGTIATEAAVRALSAGSLWDATNGRVGSQVIDGNLQIVSASNWIAEINADNLTAARTYGLPNVGGTLMVGANNLSDLANAATARTNLGLGTGDSPTFTNLTLTRGTITTSSPVAITQTWNAAGVTFTGLDINVTNTASAGASLLCNFRVGGTSQFSVDRIGIITTPVGISTRVGNFGTGSASAIDLNAGVVIGWGFDTALLRDSAADTLALRRTTNAQTFRLYGTFTDASNHRRLSLAGTTGGRFTIAAQGAGTGASGNELVLASPILTPATSVSLGTNGDLAFEATSNTSLTIRYRGSDGTTRSVALTLA